MISLLLFSAVTAWAAAQQKLDENAIVEALSPHVKTVSRPFSIFHWEKANKPQSAKFKPDTQEGALRLMQDSAKGYLASDAKRGLYFALDPALSRPHGGENWRLIQMEIPAGFKYLDLSSEGIRQALADAMPGIENCDTTFLSVYNAPSHLRRRNASNFNTSKECVNAKRKVFQKLGVSGIRYKWMRASIPGCAGKDPSAFLITDGAWMRSEAMKTYTRSKLDAPEERRILQEFTRNTEIPESLFSPVNQRIDPLWSDLPADPPIGEATRAWMKKNLVNCQRAPAQDLEEPVAPSEEKAAE